MRLPYAPAALVLLAACAGTPASQVPTSRTVAAPVGQVRDRVAAAIRDLGLTAQPTSSGVKAVVEGGAAQDWAGCQPQLIYYRQDSPPRSAWVNPDAREAVVTVSLAPEGSGTRVSVDPRFTATSTDRFRNTPVQRPCTSTGALESRLLAAAG